MRPAAGPRGRRWRRSTSPTARASASRSRSTTPIASTAIATSSSSCSTAPVDIVFGNEAEACALFEIDEVDDAITRLGEMCSLVVVTRSEKGSTLVVDGKRIDVDGVPVDKVVDTTGAGDAFAGGFLYGLTHGFDPAAVAPRSAPPARPRRSCTSAPVPRPISARCSSHGRDRGRRPAVHRAAATRARRVGRRRADRSRVEVARFDRRRHGGPVERSRRDGLRATRRPRTRCWPNGRMAGRDHADGLCSHADRALHRQHRHRRGTHLRLAVVPRRTRRPCTCRRGSRSGCCRAIATAITPARSSTRWQSVCAARRRAVRVLPRARRARAAYGGVRPYHRAADHRDAGRDRSPPANGKRLNAFLTTEQLAALEALPPLRPPATTSPRSASRWRPKYSAGRGRCSRSTASTGRPNSSASPVERRGEYRLRLEGLDHLAAALDDRGAPLFHFGGVEPAAAAVPRLRRSRLR